LPIARHVVLDVRANLPPQAPPNVSWELRMSSMYASQTLVRPNCTTGRPGPLAGASPGSERTPVCLRKKLVSLTVSLAMLGMIAPAARAQTCASPTFSTTAYSAGQTPVFVATGDFNGDALSDVAAVNRASSLVPILLGASSGVMVASGPASANSGPLAAAVADFNGDGRNDLVVANEVQKNIVVIPGDGSGGFGTAIPTAVNAFPRFVTTGDFNGDGRADAAVANANPDNITILLGVGDGSFTLHTTLPLLTSSIAVGDFNGDGQSDLAAVSGGVHIYLGTGTGSFGISTRFDAGGTPLSIAVGDLNGDAHSDLAVANGTGGATVLMGTGTGSFDSMTPVPTEGNRAAAVAIGDFDDDGHGDLAVVNVTSATLSFLFGTGTGSFEAPRNYRVGSDPRSVAVGDFNGDGRSEAVVANSGSSTVSVFIAGCVPAITSITPSTGAGAGGTAITITGSNFSTTTGATTFTFGEAAASNVVCSSSTLCTATSPPGMATVSVRATVAGQVTVDTPADDFLYGPTQSCPNPNFAAAVSSGVRTGPNSVVTGDLDGDDKTDMVVTSNVSSGIAVLIGSGAGAFRRILLSDSTGPVSAAVGDFNGDGKNDIAVANENASDMSTFLATGAGTFAATPKIAFLPATYPSFVAAGDFNGDGRIDLAVANGGRSSISILRGSGTGSFVDAGTVGVAGRPAAIAVGDFDRDGDSDLAVSTNTSNVSILLGTGTGSFVGTNVPVGGAQGRLAIGDFNGDSFSDLALVNSAVLVLLGTGTGSFGAPTAFSAGISPSAVAVGDFNGDGRSDLAVSDSGSDNVSILVGSGSGSFAAPVSFAAGTGPLGVAVGDFDGNGGSDLAVVNYYGDDVSILLSSSAAGKLVVSTPTLSVVEGAGTVMVTLDRTGGSDCSATVDYATADGSASAGSDYVATSGTLTFGAGVTTQTVSVPVSPDSLNEADETFTVTLTNPVGGARVGLPSSVVVTIVDDDVAPTVTLSVSASSIGEGGVATVTATLSAPSGQNVTVHLSLSGSATSPSDYTASNTSIVVPAGSTSGTIIITATQDAVNEATETIVIDGATIVNASATSPLHATLDITDDDPAPSLAINDVTQLEGNGGATALVFTVMLTGATSQAVSVNYATVDGTATAPADYVAASGTLTFLPGSLTQNISIATSGDTVSEPDETFNVQLSGATNATIGVAIGGGTLKNDDALPTLAISSVRQDEGSGGGTTDFVFTVTLDGLTEQTVTATYATASGTATATSDYATTSGSLTFTPGTLTQTISIPVVADAVNELDETFTVALSGATAATVTAASGTGTITNDDPLPSLSVSSPSLVEGNNNTPAMNFVVTLSAASAQTVTVNYATADGSAVAGSDYTSRSGTLTFAPGATTQVIAVPIVGDPLSEGAETFTLTLTQPLNATIATATGTGTILDDDGAATLSISSPAQAEGNGGATEMGFVVTLSPAAGQTVSVNYSTADGTAHAGSDYTATSGTLTFAPGTTTTTIFVAVAGDGANEIDETFAVNLNAAVNAEVATAAGLGTIVNDDALPTLSIGSVSQPEGDTANDATFTIALSAASGQAVLVNYSTSNGTATAGSDYTSLSGTLVFTPGVITRTVFIPILGDTAAESDETFTVALTAAVNSTIGGASGTGTIVDDDTVQAPSIASITPDSGTGGDGEVITIAGTGLGGAISVTFGGVAGALITSSETTITVTSPVHAAGPVNVVVTTAAGTAAAVNGFTFMPAVTAEIPTLSEWMLLGLAAALAVTVISKLKA
jgi:hypothetical protein